MESPEVRRVIAYVDGFNLYYGLKDSGWRRYYWLDIGRMVGRLLKPGQTLVITKYFTSRIAGPPDKVKRQSVYLEALANRGDLGLYFGHYLQHTVTCRRCGQQWPDFEEKMTDVNIATELLTDAFENRFDTALLVSADSDLVPPVRTIKRLYPDKRIILFFPPRRFSTHLKNAAHVQLTLGRALLAHNQFPEIIQKPDGIVLEKPREWKDSLQQ